MKIKFLTFHYLVKRQSASAHLFYLKVDFVSNAFKLAKRWSGACLCHAQTVSSAFLSSAPPQTGLRLRNKYHTNSR